MAATLGAGAGDEGRLAHSADRRAALPEAEPAEGRRVSPSQAEGRSRPVPTRRSLGGTEARCQVGDDSAVPGT